MYGLTAKRYFSLWHGFIWFIVSWLKKCDTVSWLCSRHYNDPPIDPPERCIMGASCATIIMTHSTVMDAKGPSQKWPTCASWSVNVPWCVGRCVKGPSSNFKICQCVRHVHKWCVTILFHMSVNLLKWCVTFNDDGCVMLPKCTTHIGTLTHHSRGSIGGSYKWRLHKSDVGNIDF